MIVTELVTHPSCFDDSTQTVVVVHFEFFGTSDGIVTEAIE
jgi:hypothetical protein